MLTNSLATSASAEQHCAQCATALSPIAIGEPGSVDRKGTVLYARCQPGAVLRFCGLFSATLAAPFLPAGARDAEFAEEIAPGVFVHQGRHALATRENAGDIANCGFIVGPSRRRHRHERQRADGRRLRACEVDHRPANPLRRQHAHAPRPRSSATPAFKPDSPVFVAHHKLARGSLHAPSAISPSPASVGEAFAGTEIVLPDRGVEERTTLELGGRRIVLEAHKTAHTDNDLTIRDEATGTLFLGDLLFAGHVPTLDGSFRGWLAVLADLRRRDAARVVPGHGPAAMSWPQALDPPRRYLERVAAT